jgi:signal transduction histidine kinase
MFSRESLTIKRKCFVPVNTLTRGFCLANFLLLLAFYGVSQPKQATPLLDSAIKYRSSQPDKAMNFARRAFIQATDKSIRSRSLLFLGVLNCDVSRYDSSLIYLGQSLGFFKSINDSSGIAEAFHNMGVAKEHLGLYQESLDYYQQGYEIRKEIGLKSEVAFSLNSIGNIYVFLNNYARALELYLVSLKISEELKNKNAIANTYNNIGMVYDYTSDLDKAFEYYDRARKAYEELGDQRGLAGVLNNIGLIYKNKRQPEKSIPYYQQSLKLFEVLKSAYGVAVLQNNIGVAYGLLNNQERALQFHRQSLATNTKIGNSDGVANSNNSIGDSYLKLKKFDKAYEYFNEGLWIATKINSKDRIAESYEGLARASEGMKDFKSALSYSQQARTLRDSLFSVQKSQKLYEMEQKYESVLKAKQIALLNSETERQKLEIVQKNELIDQRNIQLVLVIASLIFLGIAVYQFYSRLRLQQTARLVLARREKDQAIIKSIYEQRMSISKDMHDEIGSGLTHISLLSDMIATQNRPDPEMREEVQTISTISRKLVQSMSEIIWAINPQNETLENLTSYLREQTNKYFDPFNLQYSIQMPDELPHVQLTNLQRRNLFLVTKETLNNALKYADASSVSLSMEIKDDNRVCFVISDNGKGFEMDKIRRSANGLKNMQSRMAEIGGSFEINSTPQGTHVSYSVLIVSD